MQWVKAAVVGLVAALIMFLLMMLGIHVTGIAPFNQPPSAAFLDKIGLPPKPLALIVHFGYGAFWSLVLVILFKEGVNLVKGIGLSLALWLVMMVILSPIIGWGFFGFGAAGSELAPGDSLYLEAGPKYLIATLILHLVYGSVIGWGNRVWSVKSS